MSIMNNVLANKLTEIKDVPRDMHLTIFGRGAFLGEEDALFRNTSSSTMRCIS